jgi:hypothetical protein
MTHEGLLKISLSQLPGLSWPGSYVQDLHP